MYPYQMKATVPALGRSFGTGWLPPLPDLRDYTAGHPDLADLNAKLGLQAPATLPDKVDLRQWCSPIRDQGNLGSCSAHALTGIVEYFQSRANGKWIDASRLFVYKVTRNLMGVTGDTGAWLRNAMGALALCGVPPEKYWPYTDVQQASSAQERTFDMEPSSFVYAVADNYQAVKYFAHDPLGQNIAPAKVLTSVKSYLAAGIPAMFGFYGFPSSNSADVPGAFPYPCSGEQSIWGHAIAAVGYDNKLKITNKQCNTTTTGALLIRNSWSSTWGDKGYGWLPYDYVTNRLALDFWSVLNMNWVETGQFGL